MQAFALQVAEQQRFSLFLLPLQPLGPLPENLIDEHIRGIGVGLTLFEVISGLNVQTGPRDGGYVVRDETGLVLHQLYYCVNAKLYYDKIRMWVYGYLKIMMNLSCFIHEAGTNGGDEGEEVGLAVT
jgi:hypothetical protein